LEMEGSLEMEGLFELAHPLSADTGAAGTGAADTGAAGTEAASVDDTQRTLVLRAASCVSCGSNLEWLRQLLADTGRADTGEADTGRADTGADTGAQADKLSYSQIDALAAQASPGAGGLLWAPWLAGERSPFTDANARGTLVGASHATGRAELSRAVMEGVAHSVRALLERVLTEAHPTELLVCGGVTKSAVWMQVN